MAARRGNRGGRMAPRLYAISRGRVKRTHLGGGEHSGCQRPGFSASLWGEPSPGTVMTIERNARLRAVRSWGDYFHFSVEAPAVGRGARPGQFVMVKVDDCT